MIKVGYNTIHFINFSNIYLTFYIQDMSELQTLVQQEFGDLIMLKTHQEPQDIWVSIMNVLVNILAPEVMCRQNHGVSVDYFAVGVMAYECMFGRVSDR